MKQQTIVYFVILVILFSLASFSLKLTGHVTDSQSSVINITIESVVVINFTVDQIMFGAGSVNLGALNATIDTLGHVENGNWTPVTNGFIIVNEGNNPVSLDLKTNKNASTFLGGSNPAYQYNVTNNELGSCLEGDVSFGAWNDANNINWGDRVCSVFNFGDGSDSIRIDLKLIIPSDASVGVQSDTFTATGTAI